MKTPKQNASGLFCVIVFVPCRKITKIAARVESVQKQPPEGKPGGCLSVLRSGISVEPLLDFVRFVIIAERFTAVVVFL